MNIDLFPENLCCNCQNPYLKIKKTCDIPLHFSQSFLLPLVLKQISYGRIKTTYQHDFGESNNRTPMIYDNSIIIDDSEKSSTSTKILHDNIECRPAPKLPYLHGHNIPGKKRQKILLSQMNNNENRQNINVVRLDNQQKVYRFKDRKITKSIMKPSTKIHNHSSSYIDENYGDNTLNDNNIQESKKTELTNTNTDSVTNGLYTDSYEKFTINRRYINTDSSTDKKTGDIIEKFSASPWISEYQDTIGGTAEKILKIQLHSHKRHKTIINQKAI